MYSILDQLKGIVDYTEVTITQLQGDALTILDYEGPMPREKMIGEQILLEHAPIHQWVLNEQRPITIADLHTPTPITHTLQNIYHTYAETSQLRSWMAVPLNHPNNESQPQGLISFSHNCPDFYSTTHAERIRAFAEYITLVALEGDLAQPASHLSTLEERYALSQESRYNTAQVLGYVKLRLYEAHNLLDTANFNAVRTNLQDLQQVVDELYTDIREEVFNPRLAIASGLDLLDALHAYAAKYKKFHYMDVALVNNVPAEVYNKLATGIKPQLIRIIQEALINVRQHAGVEAATLTLDVAKDNVIVTVADEGQGFTPEEVVGNLSSGFGLQVMQERAQSIDSTLKIESAPGQGTRVMIYVPVVKQPYYSPALTRAVMMRMEEK